jgi:hypothetical protein
MSFFLFNIQTIICIYNISQENFCKSNFLFTMPLLSLFPFHLRSLQCLRRLYDTKEKVHFYNFLKNFSSEISIILSYIAQQFNKG